MQVEPGRALLGDLPLTLGFAGLGRQHAQVDHRQREVQLGLDQLHRFAVDQRKGGAQYIVACYQGLQRPTQSPFVERAREFQCTRQVVRIADIRFELVEKPQAQLCG